MAVGREKREETSVEGSVVEGLDKLVAHREIKAKRNERGRGQCREVFHQSMKGRSRPRSKLTRVARASAYFACFGHG